MREYQNMVGCKGFWSPTSGEFRKSHRINAFVEARLLVDPASGRHRIPDVTVVETPHQTGKVLVDVPTVVVEIKSPDDTFDDIIDRCFDFEKPGVPNILVMDPEHKRAWLFERGSLRLLTGSSMPLDLSRTGQIDFPFAEMFAELDEED